MLQKINQCLASPAFSDVHPQLVMQKTQGIFFFLKPFLKALMAAEFCMATRTSSAHTSQNIKPTQVPLIMKVSEEKPLTDTSVESYYLVHTDYNKQPGFGTEQQGCQNRNYWDYSSES